MVVNTVGHLAEAAWHHPDLNVSYAFVTVKLMNHAAKGVTIVAACDVFEFRTKNAQRILGGLVQGRRVKELGNKVDVSGRLFHGLDALLEVAHFGVERVVTGLELCVGLPLPCDLGVELAAFVDQLHVEWNPPTDAASPIKASAHIHAHRSG